MLVRLVAGVGQAELARDVPVVVLLGLAQANEQGAVGALLDGRGATEGHG